jgi:hypothetical protein
MKSAWLFALLLTLGIQSVNATPSHAQVRPDNRPIARDFTNERGFTLDMFDGKLWALAHDPLSPVTMDQFGAAVHRAPTRGIQFELLTPGDFGVSMHIYW